jgi:dihydrofolate reductase
VVTHSGREPLAQASGTFTFVGDVAEAVEGAVAAAGDRKAVVMGADLARQALQAGLVDELLVSHVPVLLGGGSRLFDGTATPELATVEVVASPTAAHARYRVVR